MRVQAHIAASLSLAALFWFFTKSIYAAVICLATGIFMDIDHIIDYAINFGWKGITLKKVYEASEETCRNPGEGGFPRIYLIFHMHELMIILWLLFFYTNNIYLLAFTVGYSVHLIMDSMRSIVNLYSYFLIWRIIKGFDARAFHKCER